MRVAVLDIGTNSTRLLIADVVDGDVVELDRRSIVTRLGHGVDASGVLAREAIERVAETLATYRAAIDTTVVEATTAVLTSAARDASNGSELVALLRDRFAIEAHTISGEHEAWLTFLGATSARGQTAPERPLVVIDIGGGSTELVVGATGAMSFHTSTQVGVVRQGERHLRSDPPTAHELAALASEVSAIFKAAVPADVRASVGKGIAVAGTATQSAAIDLALATYDRSRVNGHHLRLATIEHLRDELAALGLAERRGVTGLHPDRAPTIVAGTAILIEAMRAFGLDEVEVSEHDLLRGAALELASAPAQDASDN